MKPKNKHPLIDMLSYRRKHGTDSIKDFCEKYLHPTFGYPDADDNYELIIGDNPTICYAAHYDTVHKSDGRQKVVVNDHIISLAPNSRSNCLGADCATGVWLILEMIEAGIEGIYVIHGHEEAGCRGSKALVQHNPKWLDTCKVVISFDRMGYDSIITHQTGIRTCSDNFANSLADILDMPYKTDTNGSYTDSNEYRELVPECTNLSVGYWAQHSKLETQNLEFAVRLSKALKKADWSKLVIERDPTVIEYDQDSSWSRWYGSPYSWYEDDYLDGVPSAICPAVKANFIHTQTFVEIADLYYVEVAELLEDFFGNPEALIDALAEYGADTTKAAKYYRY